MSESIILEEMWPGLKLRINYLSGFGLISPNDSIYIVFRLLECPFTPIQAIPMPFFRKTLHPSVQRVCTIAHAKTCTNAHTATLPIHYAVQYIIAIESILPTQPVHNHTDPTIRLNVMLQRKAQSARKRNSLRVLCILFTSPNSGYTFSVSVRNDSHIRAACMLHSSNNIEQFHSNYGTYRAYIQTLKSISI